MGRCRGIVRGEKSLLGDPNDRSAEESGGRPRAARKQEAREGGRRRRRSIEIRSGSQQASGVTHHGWLKAKL